MQVLRESLAKMGGSSPVRTSIDVEHVKLGGFGTSNPIPNHTRSNHMKLQSRPNHPKLAKESERTIELDFARFGSRWGNWSQCVTPFLRFPQHLHYRLDRFNSTTVTRII